MSIQVFLFYFLLLVFFFFLPLSRLSYLYILELNPLSHIWFASIFSHSVDCFFVLLVVFFAVQKKLNLI